MFVSEAWGGILVSAGESKYLIDPARKKVQADQVFVSHAHSDHVYIGAAGTSPYFMTPPTHSLIRKKIPLKATAKTLSLRKKQSHANENVSFVSAGHILGSAQIVIEGEQTICATTDFKLQDSIIQEGAEIVPCDTLVIESTFGMKEFSFPPREQVYEEMGAWIREVQQQGGLPVLAGYATGKAQELTKMVNEYTNTIPFVHESVFEKNQVYESHEARLGAYEKIDHNLPDAQLLILPPSLCTPHVLHAIAISAKRNIRAAKATGWQWKNGFERNFPLSDHADYAQLLRYVKEAEPKQVYTHHGFEDELARSITRELGIPAKSLKEAPQQALMAYERVPQFKNK